MDSSNFDSHSKMAAFGKVKDLAYEHYTLYTEINKNKTDSASNSVCLSQFAELMYSCVPSINDFS